MTTARAPRASWTSREPTTDQREHLHDVRHQVATVIMLAAALDVQDAAGTRTTALAGHLVTESRRLDDLIASMARHPSGVAATAGPPPIVRLDELVRGVTGPFRVVDGPTVRVHVADVVVRHDHLPLWRALRNLLHNARDAAGPAGHVDVRLFTRGGWAVVEVEDDGPGLAPGPLRDDAQGLSIVRALAHGWGGRLDLATGSRAGCRARLFVPLRHDDVEAG